MQFIVTGYDGNDDKAMERRLAVREKHLETFKANYEKGIFLFASAILNEENQMIGSMIICQFSSEKKLKENWLKNEPYVTGDVWKTIEIKRAKVPELLSR